MMVKAVTHVDIDREKDARIVAWLAEEGWKGADHAIWADNSEIGFWVWWHRSEGGLLAIHEPIVRERTADELIAYLRLLGVAEDMRKHGKVRVWEGARITRY
jgi:hypothetical protein